MPYADPYYKPKLLDPLNILAAVTFLYCLFGVLLHAKVFAGMEELAVISLVILVAAAVCVVPIVWVLVQLSALVADLYCLFMDFLSRGRK